MIGTRRRRKAPKLLLFNSSLFHRIMRKALSLTTRTDRYRSCPRTFRLLHNPHAQVMHKQNRKFRDDHLSPHNTQPRRHPSLYIHSVLAEPGIHRLHSFQSSRMFYPLVFQHYSRNPDRSLAGTIHIGLISRYESSATIVYAKLCSSPVFVSRQVTHSELLLY